MTDADFAYLKEGETVFLHSKYYEPPVEPFAARVTEISYGDDESEVKARRLVNFEGKIDPDTGETDYRAGDLDGDRLRRDRKDIFYTLDEAAESYGRQLGGECCSLLWRALVCASSDEAKRLIRQAIETTKENP